MSQRVFAVRISVFSTVLALVISLPGASAAIRNRPPYVAYPGPALPDTAVATISLWKVHWVRVDSTLVKFGKHDSIKVQAGTRAIEWGGKLPGGLLGKNVRGFDTIRLEGGHVYAPHIDYDHPFGMNYEYYAWIEDAQTGLVISGTKKPSRMTAVQRKTIGTRSAVQADLFVACVDGDTATVGAILDEGYDVDSHDTGGWTALMKAAAHGQVAVMRLLIARGAEVNLQDAYDQTALMQASIKDPSAITLLLDSGADPNLRLGPPYGSTALMIASAEDKPSKLNVECVRRLLANPRTDVNAIGSEGQTALMYAARTRAHDTARLLLEHGAEINARDAHDKTALDWASGGQMKKLLMEAGAKSGKDLARTDSDR